MPGSVSAAVLGCSEHLGSGALVISLYLLSPYYCCNGPYVVPSPVVVHLPSFVSGCSADFLPTWVGSCVGATTYLLNSFLQGR